MKEIKNTNDFKKVINSDKPVLLDFYADWCGPCKSLMPIVEELSFAHNEHFSIVKVNIDQNQELASHFQVRSIPSLFFIKNKVVLEHLHGYVSKNELENKIKQYSNNKGV